ncbi:hypothetical protein [Chlorogloea sp. CCALA 695]|uniref:hypothetical protein n=1 Tax=Chlorogloea sp. CCALA 695 TaxID=2107693 RepID=UPI0011B21890|nr:hypothetical protein [Chlorogloea sp. CCALA 695]
MGLSLAARRTITGYEILNMMGKGQILGHPLGAVKERIIFINRRFGVVAQSKPRQRTFFVLTKFLQHNQEFNCPALMVKPP